MTKLTKELVLYLIMGAATTVVNFICYFLLKLLLSPALSTVISWFASVLFAYITNSKWVFNSKAITAKEHFKQIASFFAARVLSGIFDIGATVIFIEKLHLNDLFVKIAINVIVIIFNYVASKLVIFKNKNIATKHNNK